jgi:hypothetical protein
VAIWYIFPLFGILDQEKSGNPDSKAKLDSGKERGRKILSVARVTRLGRIFTLPVVAENKVIYQL